jgi:hypothetical protein
MTYNFQLYQYLINLGTYDVCMNIDYEMFLSWIIMTCNYGCRISMIAVLFCMNNVQDRKSGIKRRFL